MLGQNFTFIAQVPAPATKDDASEEEPTLLTDHGKKDKWNARDKARRQEKQKAEAFMASLDGDDVEEGAPKKKTKVKKSAAKEKGAKGKKMADLWEDDEDENDNPLRQFMVYLDIKSSCGWRFSGFLFFWSERVDFSHFGNEGFIEVDEVVIRL